MVGYLYIEESFDTPFKWAMGERVMTRNKFKEGEQIVLIACVSESYQSEASDPIFF